MSFTTECCSTPPFQTEYTPTGKTFKLKDDLDCYAVGDPNSKAAIIYLYDIFNLHPNAYQGCDILARSGFRVIMPDIFRKDPTPVQSLGNPEKFMDFINRKATYEVLKDDFALIKNYIKNVEGFENVFLIGFCVGSKMAMILSAHDPFYKAGALIHPTLLEISDFEKAQFPVVLLPAKTDRDFSEDFAVISAKPFGNLCYHQRFDDMVHGFCSARGDWTDALNSKRANEAFSISVSTFYKVLKSQGN
ncbi:hypothetical protein BB558_000296 [Smittium angustum]|uniref:Dienelactone hydrolase domain-containing protein n=1 Tax=Smittium angustum TaxID=133377 RepID=A0A2U1JEU3_SMIAN|nr:hypothetical protein BB558_000296 [Smittium angustum]